MNRISAVSVRSAVCVCALLVSCAQAPAQSSTPDDEGVRTYDVTYTLRINEEGDATASIQVDQPSRHLRELRFSIDPERHRNFAGDGEVSEDDEQVTWTLPRRGGTLTYDVTVSNQRGSGSYDARLTEQWGLFRGDDIFPSAATRTVVGAESVSTLEFELPDGWSALTPFVSGDHDLSFPVSNPERQFDRPTGWMLIGDIGVRRGLIGGTRVAIGAPVGEGVHRMDIMAFLNWTLPVLRDTFPMMDERVIIVSAGDPMWRGGLSGPGSLFIHADRPIISENGTSSLLHELVHVAMGTAGSDHDDWMIEGLAEFYSIKIMQKTGTLSNRRSELTLESLTEWGESVDDLFVSRSSGPVTARAVTLLADLDAYLAERSRGRRSLDDVVDVIAEADMPYNYRSLCIAAKDVARGPVPILAPDAVPGAANIPECSVDP